MAARCAVLFASPLSVMMQCNSPLSNAEIAEDSGYVVGDYRMKRRKKQTHKHQDAVKLKVILAGYVSVGVLDVGGGVTAAIAPSSPTLVRRGSFSSTQRRSESGHRRVSFTPDSPD